MLVLLACKDWCYDAQNIIACRSVYIKPPPFLRKGGGRMGHYFVVLIVSYPPIMNLQPNHQFLWQSGCNLHSQ